MFKKLQTPHERLEIKSDPKITFSGITYRMWGCSTKTYEM